MIRGRVHHLLPALVLLAVATACGQRVVQPPEDPTRRLGIALRRLWTDARILYVTAHPDDEDNRLLAYYGLGRGVECTLLTVTRGEGGQNALGPELFEALGVLRMQELRAAHRYDGAGQRFSRAFEFGYSFSDEETLLKWGEEEILKDIVRVIRELRPHVILTMPTGGAGGGRHHQASAKLTRRAFDVAATETWPELGAPHRASRLFEQVWSTAGQRGASLHEVPVDLYDPLLGCTYAELGYRARSMHKCQATGQVDHLGDRRALRRSIWKQTAGDPAPRGGDLLAGLIADDRSAAGRESWPVWLSFLWGRRETLDPLEPAATRKLLLEAEHLRRESGDDSPRCVGLREALIASLPFLVEAVADTDVVVPGQEFTLRVELHNRSAVPVEVSACRLAGLVLSDVASVEEHLHRCTGALGAGQRRSVALPVRLDRHAANWTAVRLGRVGGVDRYGVHTGDRLPSTAAAQLEVILILDGVRLVLPSAAVVHRFLDERNVEAREVDLALLPPATLRFEPAVIVVPLEPGREGHRDLIEVEAELTIRDARTVRVRVQALPAAEHSGVQDAPQTPWTFVRGPTRKRITLSVIPDRSWSCIDALRADVRDEVGGRLVPSAIVHQGIDYPHVRRAWLERPSDARVVPVRSTLPRSSRIGYVRGSGDRVGDALAQVGLNVRFLEAEDLLEGDLDRFDVILAGVRAYKTRADLGEATPRLLRWMRAGGRMVVQYNKTGEMNGGPRGEAASPFLPYPGRVGSGRVTVEESPVKILEPDHPLLTTPNRLEAADFDGWVQERGLYFLEEAGPHYRYLLELADPFPFNAGPKRGALVTAEVGRGSWTYVGLALFRQIPAGVPGAWKLLLNLVAKR